MKINTECLAMGGWPHFREAGSGQVSSVAGPNLDSVAALVQLPGASLGIPAASDFSRHCIPHAQRGLSVLLPSPRVTAAAWYPARLLEGMGGSQLYVIPVQLSLWGGVFSGFLPLLQRQTTSPPAQGRVLSTPSNPIITL